MNTHQAVRAWIESWEAGWPTEDVDVIAARYPPDAPYRSHPFREPTSAREYVSKAFTEETLIRCWFGEPIVQGDRAAVEYWAILHSPDGTQISIAGHSRTSGSMRTAWSPHRDYWTQLDGAEEPPSGWGSGSW